MTLRRVIPLTLATLVLLLGGQVAAAANPLDEYGLVLPNGGVADTPTPTAWGTPIDPAIRSQLERRAARLRAEPGRVWISWDETRSAPREMIVSGVPAPGVMRSGSLAQMFAELWLARHVELLAPGSDLADFELVSNELSANLRSVGFRQLHDGIPVVGGQLSLIFAGDKLIHVGSQALPWVTRPHAVGALLSTADAGARARDWIAADYPGASLRVIAGAEHVILPLLAAGQYQYREVLRVEVRSDAPAGHWAVYVDAHTGELVAREQLLRSVGELRFDVPTRHPLGAREDAVAPELGIVESGNPKVTDLLGQFELSNNPSVVATSVAGPLVAVDNSGGPEATTNLVVTEGQTAVWSLAGDQLGDAQLSAFVHASRGKAYVRAIDPGFAWLDEVLPVRVNVNGSCNAFADEQGIHFFRESNQCANMGRVADVVYHELGHRVHMESLIPGVGAFDGALSEGVSDYLASTMVDDSGMGRGFYKNEQPLREINPNNSEYVWPEDISNDTHMTGLIIAGALWDLRTGLIAAMGPEAGVAHADHIYYQATRRAVDIPSMYAQAVIADDDNDDLSDGSPHICLINEVFAAHGLYQLDALAGIELELSAKLDGYEVTAVATTPLLDGCPDSVEAMTLRWRPRDEPNMTEDLPMQLVDGVWVATIPSQAAGTVVEYRVEGEFADGASLARPLNLADPWYEAYFGGVEPIYCLDANADLDAWTLSGGLWSFGDLVPGGGDPSAPYDGDGVQLSMDGEYDNNSEYAATSPMIDISGYDDVRLHYYRWLSVEDSNFDLGTILANGEHVWVNLWTQGGQTHHLDGEWRFHDVELAEFIPDGEVELSFELRSDQGLEFGGWNIDALCVVGVTELVCGDGKLEGAEQCDDGNAVDGDGCDAQCQLEEPDDTDTGMEADDSTDSGDTTEDTTDGDESTDVGDDESDSGNGGETDTGTEGAGAGPIDDGGCNCSTPATGDSRGWAAAWLLALAGLGFVRRKRA